MKTDQKPVHRLIALGSARANTKALNSGNNQETLMTGRYD